MKEYLYLDETGSFEGQPKQEDILAIGGFRTSKTPKETQSHYASFLKTVSKAVGGVR